MGRKAFAVALGATAFAFALNVAPTQAQPTRVFVAAQGSDANPCTFAQPCRTFQHAHDTVAAGGEIDVLDPAGYGALNINKAISIQGHGFAGIAVTGGGNAISIDAGATDKINLRGLLIDGVGTGGNGITFSNGGSLNVQGSVVRNMGNIGILIETIGSYGVFVSDTMVADNLNGIVAFNDGSGTITVTLDQVALINHPNGVGVDVESLGSGATTRLVLTRSEVSGNFNGVSANRNLGAAAVSAFIRDTVISNNINGVVAQQGSVIWVGQSTVTGNGTGLLNAGTGGGPAVIHSYGDNNVDGNGTDGSPTDTIPAK